MALYGRINTCLTLLQPTLLEPVPPHIDMGARSGKRQERIPDAVVNEVLARLEAILS